VLPELKQTGPKLMKKKKKIYIYIHIHIHTHAIIYTDNRISLDSVHNPNNHSFLVEEIRKKVASLERSG
jgi:hypothetical protein